VDHRDGLHVVEKRRILLLLGFEPRPSNLWLIAIPAELTRHKMHISKWGIGCCSVIMTKTTENPMTTSRGQNSTINVFNIREFTDLISNLKIQPTSVYADFGPTIS
jgi:hypothetical protein